MAEIKINIIELDNAISKLKTLNSKFVLNKTTAPEIVGGGQTVNELEAIAMQFQNIDSHLEVLVSNTIHLLQNMKNSYISSDQKTARGIGGGGNSGGAGTSRNF